MSKSPDEMRDDLKVDRLAELMEMTPDAQGWVEWAAHEAEDRWQEAETSIELDSDQQFELIASWGRLARCRHHFVKSIGMESLLEGLTEFVQAHLDEWLRSSVAHLDFETWKVYSQEILNRHIEDLTSDTTQEVLGLLMSLDDADLVLRLAFSQGIVDEQACDPIEDAIDFVLDHSADFLEASGWLISMVAAMEPYHDDPMIDITTYKFGNWLSALEDVWAEGETSSAPFGLFPELLQRARQQRSQSQIASEFKEWQELAPMVLAASAAESPVSQRSLYFQSPAGDFEASIALPAQRVASGPESIVIRIDTVGSASVRGLGSVSFAGATSKLIVDESGVGRATVGIDLANMTIDSIGDLRVDGVVWILTRAD